MRTSLRPLHIVVAGLLELTPFVACAEERDPGEIGHAIFILTMISLLFLGSLAFGIWLIIARLRSEKEMAASSSGSGPSQRRPDFEAIWFPKSTALSTPPTPPPPSE